MSYNAMTVDWYDDYKVENCRSLYAIESKFEGVYSPDWSYTEWSYYNKMYGPMHTDDYGKLAIRLGLMRF